MQDEFKNLKEVAEFLDADGWKVAQSTVYKHAKEGLFRPDRESKKYRKKDVLKYAGMYLRRKDTDQRVNYDDLQEKKLKMEIARLSEHAQLRRLERLAKEGKLVPWENVELQLAARGVVIDQTMTYHFQTRAGELIQLVEGNEEKTGDLVRELMALKDEILNEFATKMEFEVVIGGGE